MAKAVQKTGSSTRRIFVVDGGKGGAGKTMCAMMIADREVVRGNADRLLVLDADTANGDLSKRFSNAPCMTTDTDLRTADGWVGAVNKIDQYSDRADKIVVSLPANSILDSGCRSLRSVRDELNY
jgi:cellulose biosynthesis protein BcsQ